MKRTYLLSVLISHALGSLAFSARPMDDATVPQTPPTPALLVMESSDGSNRIKGAIWDLEKLELRIEVAKVDSPKFVVNAHTLDALHLIPLALLRDCIGWEAEFKPYFINPPISGVKYSFRFSASGACRHVESRPSPGAPEGGVLTLHFKVTPGSPGLTAQKRADLNCDGVVDNLDLEQHFCEIKLNDGLILRIVTGDSTLLINRDCREICCTVACQLFQYGCEEQRDSP